MKRRSKILLAAALASALVLAWYAGFSTGSSRGDAATRPGGADAGRAGARDEAHSSRVGLPERVGGNDLPGNEQNLPWTRERLKRAISSVNHDPSIVRAFRTAIRLADSMTENAFPGVIEESRDLLEDGDLSEVCKMALLARWMELNPRAAGDYLSKNKELGGFIDIPGELLGGVWAASNPAEGVRWAREVGEPDHIKRILRGLARRDPDEALAFAAANLPEMKPGEVASVIAEDGWQSGTPEEAARRLGALPESRDLHQVAKRWAKEDTADSLDWADSLADPEARSAAINGVFEVWSEKDPAAAAAWILNDANASAKLDGAINHIVNQWMKKDRESTKQWAAQLPDVESRRQAFEAIAGTLVDADPKACAAWLETVPPSPERDKAIERFTNHVVREDPSVAVKWALTVEDPNKRASLLRDLSAEWFKRDPGAAFSWLQDSPELSEEDRHAVLKSK